jgi:hypothetical protein
MRRRVLPIDAILLCSPEILIGFVHLRTFLLLLFQSGEAFLLLVPLPRSRHLFGLATDQERRTDDQADELKMLHRGDYTASRIPRKPFK